MKKLNHLRITRRLAYMIIILFIWCFVLTIATVGNKLKIDDMREQVIDNTFNDMTHTSINENHNE